MGMGRAELASDMLALVVAGGREGGGAAGTAAGRAEGGRGELSRMKQGLALAPQVGTLGTLGIDVFICISMGCAMGNAVRYS